MLIIIIMYFYFIDKTINFLQIILHNLEWTIKWNCLTIYVCNSSRQKGGIAAGVIYLLLPVTSLKNIVPVEYMKAY